MFKWLMALNGFENKNWTWDNDRRADTQFVCFKDPHDAMLFKLTFGEWVK